MYTDFANVSVVRGAESRFGTEKIGGKWMNGQYREALRRSRKRRTRCSHSAAVNGQWILAATILGSSMAFIDGTVVNVALPPALFPALCCCCPSAENQGYP